MREYKDKKDRSKKSYYKDRFFIQKETKKLDPSSTRYRSDFDRLKKFDLVDSYVEFDNLVVYVLQDKNLELLTCFKELGYEVLVEISGVDFIQSRGGIEVFYLLLNTKDAKRARLKTLVRQGTMLKSATNLYKSANWSERELYDMFGVLIDGHPNLKRLLMPDDWNSNPLLKSYPLTGDDFSAWYEVDKIFGKEAREIIGPENRDPAFIDEKDTFNFVRIYHETEYGKEPKNEPFVQEYQESGGVKFVKKITKEKAQILKKRP